MMSPEQVAANFGLSVATLADWRSQKRGPNYIKTGGNIWYPEEFVDSWAESQIVRTSNAIEGKKREVALPVPSRREKVRGNNRFGRHVTKREKSAGNGTGLPAGPGGGPPSHSESGSPRVQ